MTFVVKAPTEAHNVGLRAGQVHGQAHQADGSLPDRAPNSPNQVTPFFIYGSDPPGTPYEGSTMHGNGFYATPLADGIRGGLRRTRSA